MVIVQHLGRTLPDRYVAEPRVHLGSFDHPGGRTATHFASEVDDGSTAWSPAEPTLAVETELADADEYEVRVYDADHGRQLVAAIELISPANKDRPESRRQFVAKCASLLQQHVSVVLVDLVTARDVNLYAELLEWIGEQDPALGNEPPNLNAISCLWRPRGASRWLETWNHPLTPGQPLPILPLWLSDDLAVPLDLESSYEQTCRDLRIV